MPKRKRVSRPHPKPEAPRRLETKARRLEREEERRPGSALSILKALDVQKTPPAHTPAKETPSEKRSSDDSPDLLALLTGRKKTEPKP